MLLLITVGVVELLEAAVLGDTVEGTLYIGRYSDSVDKYVI
jgi:hypothetical protein